MHLWVDTDSAGFGHGWNGMIHNRIVCGKIIQLTTLLVTGTEMASIH